MSQILLDDEIEMSHGHPDLYKSILEEILNTLDDADTGFFIEVDSKNPKNTRQKTKNFPFCPENEIIKKDIFIEHMKKN